MMLKKLVLPLLHAVNAQEFNITITSSFNTDIAPGSKVHFSESADTDPWKRNVGCRTRTC